MRLRRMPVLIAASPPAYSFRRGFLAQRQLRRLRLLLMALRRGFMALPLPFVAGLSQLRPEVVAGFTTSLRLRLRRRSWRQRCVCLSSSQSQTAANRRFRP